MKPLSLECCGKKYPMRLKICSYTDNGNLAIELFASINRHWEPWNMLTVNVTPRFGPNFALIDTNHNGEQIIKWLAENGLGIPTVGAERSGFCVYPEFMFFEKKLREISEPEYEAHLKQWRRFHPSYRG